MSRNTAAVAELTRRLVSIPSHDDERAAGDEIEAWLRAETDAAVRRDDHGNVIARRGEGEASLALVGHHDVVDPHSSQVTAGTPDGSDPAYVVEERDGRLYGRGAADMKGSLAAAMCAFRDADPGAELVFASFVGEEQGGVGARAAIDDGFAPDYAVVGEGTTGYSAPDATDVAVAHRGRRGSTLTASGRAAHASEPDAGVNAVYRACDAVDVVRDLPTPGTTVLGHRMQGSVAVTGIEGGSGWNVVPEACSVTVDERTIPGGRVPLERAENVEGVEWVVDQDLPPMACGDAGFADAALAAADAAQSATPEHVVKPHATDAGWLSDAGTTCVIAGASEPGEAHTADESVSIDVVERCRRLYQDLAERWPVE
ncbi:acetylornithine deacetylase [Halobellus salinus]|uniref:Acetylornithine deacetylase n=1 Tax=Halobellus salinus TaxID=931585 RepID=A0A830ENR9_9EURY|nr:M20/M25/M40 family metallo-hydrolase [Halobellus salinus]GGI94911.1 acetylornithine deacetylase [Halobellus salinus]SMP20410.1 acetylornithine deacetylase [Halobellus salinus]